VRHTAGVPSVRVSRRSARSAAPFGEGEVQ
jgi:hypothetical protein